MRARNAREDARGTGLVAVPGLGGLEQQIGQLGMAPERERKIVERLLEGCPAGQAELAREGELDVAQARIGGTVGQHGEQPVARGGVAGAQGPQPGLGFLLEAFQR